MHNDGVTLVSEIKHVIQNDYLVCWIDDLRNYHAYLQDIILHYYYYLVCVRDQLGTS